jgi:hypothetical protein
LPRAAQSQARARHPHPRGHAENVRASPNARVVAVRNAVARWERIAEQGVQRVRTSGDRVREKRGTGIAERAA